MQPTQVFYLTPLVMLGEQRYRDMEAMAKRIMEKKYGPNAKGVPVLIFDGRGGHFDMAMPHSD